MKGAFVRQILQMVPLSCSLSDNNVGGDIVKLYQIKHHSYSNIVEAESTLEAVSTWINHINETEFYDRAMDFNPKAFSIEELGSVGEIVKASE
jgi:hypothetical protein